MVAPRQTEWSVGAGACSIAGIREASMDEIAAVPGMTLKLAQRLKEYR